MDEKRQSARKRAVGKIMSLVTWLLVLIGVLTVGYAILPFIQLAFNILFLGTGISLGIVIFVVVAAVFSLTVIRFISSASALIGLGSDTLAKLMPNLSSERLSVFRKIFLNFCFLVFIIIAYWVASPFIALIPGIGVVLSLTLKIVVIAVMIIFFWGIGGTIYREIETIIGRIVADSEEVRLAVSKVKEKALKTIVYFLALILVVIASYALISLISFSFNILIPTIAISVGLLTFVVILGILSLIAVRFVTSAATLLGITSDTLAKFIPNLAPARSAVQRIFVDFSLLTFVLVVYWVVYNLLMLTPKVGIILANASQVVVAAILVIFFWDIGRTIYTKLEDVINRITAEHTEG